MQLRALNVDPVHPTGFNLNETPFLHYAEYVKKHVDNLLVETIGGKKGAVMAAVGYGSIVNVLTERE